MPNKVLTAGAGMVCSVQVVPPSGDATAWSSSTRHPSLDLANATSLADGRLEANAGVEPAGNAAPIKTATTTAVNALVRTSQAALLMATPRVEPVCLPLPRRQTTCAPPIVNTRTDSLFALLAVVTHEGGQSALI